MHVHPYQGNYKQINKDSSSNKELDEYEIVAIANKLNIKLDDMKQMSFVSLLNIMISNIDEKEDYATQEQIDAMFG